jgi:hypothetical protein
MKEKSISYLIVLIYFAVVASYFTGIVHTFKKHNKIEALVSIGAFPWAIYRGIEYWWHDDFADVNWKERISSDALQGIALIQTCAQQDANTYQLAKDLNEFASRVNKYPADRLKELKEKLKHYISYEISVSTDILNAVKGAESGGSWRVVFSEQTHSFEKQLFDDGLGFQIESLKGNRDQVMNFLNGSNFKKLTREEWLKFVKEMEIVLQFQKSEYKRAMRIIFKK